MDPEVQEYEKSTEPVNMRPSSPIPITQHRRGRSRTLDSLNHHHHHHHGPPSIPTVLTTGIPLRHHRSPPRPFLSSLSPQEPLPPPSIPHPGPPLEPVDSMRLRLVRNEHGKNLGLKVIDFNNPNGNANICAPLSLADANTGLVFSVDSVEGITAAYTRAKNMTGSNRIMGIMFAPPIEPGAVTRDVDWSCLTPEAEVETEKTDGAKEVPAVQAPDLEAQSPIPELPCRLGDFKLRSR
ncbi:hypothetical protein F66182_7154 [Fusarium sp. NRRL 66182]|nr:hypothetical protein F66182_7154 [Fusarium sp. NRRL 66182]